MPRLCYFRRMNDILPEVLAAQEAADALVALGYKVIRHSCASDLWQVEGYIITEMVCSYVLNDEYRRVTS